MKQKLLYTIGGVGIGLMLAAVFRDIEQWAVTLGLFLVVFAIIARFFWDKTRLT
ncbi:hypothetical protein HY086_06725 [Candidatus Gottesmanbacteria bacterium]|nr:hypothetical protein [Candidatus Gottesmanbacteria bacterium]